MANGIRILGSFDMVTDKPIDTRFTVENINALLAIPSYQKYIGLQTYVSDINTRFKWNGSNFEVEHVGYCAGDGKPTASQYQAGDIYIDKSSGDVYYKQFSGSSISWVYQTNIIGPKGDKGDTGPKGVHGSYWYSGNGITGTSTTPQVFPNSGIAQAEFNDQYINTITGNLYKCTTAGNPNNALWAYSGTCLKGPKGDKGDQGPTGPEGVPGPTGPQGIRGTKYNFGNTGFGPCNNTKLPGIEEFNVISGDMYINTTYGHYYRTTGEGSSKNVNWTRMGVLYGSRISIVARSMNESISTSYTYPQLGIEYSNLYDVIVNTQNGAIYYCTKEGNADTAEWLYYGSIRVKATDVVYDSSNSIKDIVNTGIKSISSSNGQLTYTTIGNKSITINLTMKDLVGATTSAAGTHGLVPAPAAGNANRYLRSDATWQVPPNTTYGTGTATKSGLTKLYTGTGSATDGTMTQKAITDSLGTKLNSNANAVSASKLKTARKINGVAFNGTADITIYANPNATQLTNQNLNDTRTYGEYYGSGGNTVSNKPSGIDPFWLKVFRSASGYTSQMLYDSVSDKLYTRTYQSGTWTGWVSYYSSKNPQATISGNASTANKLATARTITLGGDCSGSVSFDGSANVTLTATVKDDSHSHTIANIDNLQTTLNGKLGKSANAVSASKWATARTITLGGDCSGSVSIDGSANVTLTASVKDDSHNHTIANVDNLQSSLDAKLATSSANYVKTLSISGRNITVTKGDGSTSTLTTQDTNTTYSDMKGATTSAAGTHGLVPAPAAGNANRYLRSDATWQVPPNTTYSTGTATKSGLTKLYTSTGTSTDGTMTRAAITSALNGKLNSNANAVSATKLATARTISLTGDVTGSASFDGTANISISTTVSGGKITCDTALSSTSTNPVQNKVIYAKIQELETRITTAQNTANAAKTVTDKYQTLLNIIGNNQ